MSNEIAILEPHRTVTTVTPEMRERAQQRLAEYRARRLAGEVVSDGTAEVVAGAVGATIDSALGRAVGYGGVLSAEAEVEHRTADGSTTSVRLKFSHHGKQ